MKKAYNDSIIVLALLTGSQIISVILNFSNSLALLAGLTASIYYLFQEDYINREEAFSGAAGFFASSLIFAAVKKYFVLDDLCSVAEASETVESFSGVLDRAEACKTVFEAWSSSFAADPLQNIVFWIFTVAVGVLAALLYRKYRGE